MKTKLNNIPYELRKLRRWVYSAPADKRPLQVFDGKPASSTNTLTWGTFDEIRNCLEEHDGYAGFVFADDGYIGIDLDHIGQSGHETSESIEIMKAFSSYTEVSKSGHGRHIIVKGDLPFNGRKNCKGYEIYKTARFFVLTGDVSCFPWTREIKECQEQIDWFVETFMQETELSGKSGGGSNLWSVNHEQSTKHSIKLTGTYDTVSEGNRHMALVSYCGQWWAAGVSVDELLDRAIAINQTHLQPPLDTEEVLAIVKSCTRYSR